MGRPFQEKFADVKWEVNQAHLDAWKEGRTGVPIVDAAMRQLNTMGKPSHSNCRSAEIDWYQAGCIIALV